MIFIICFTFSDTSQYVNMKRSFRRHRNTFGKNEIHKIIKWALSEDLLSIFQN